LDAILLQYYILTLSCNGKNSVKNSWIIRIGIRIATAEISSAIRHPVHHQKFIRIPAQQTDRRSKTTQSQERNIRGECNDHFRPNC